MNESEEPDNNNYNVYTKRGYYCSAVGFSAMKKTVLEAANYVCGKAWAVDAANNKSFEYDTKSKEPKDEVYSMDLAN